MLKLPLVCYETWILSKSIVEGFLFSVFVFLLFLTWPRWGEEVCVLTACMVKAWAPHRLLLTHGMRVSLFLVAWVGVPTGYVLAGRDKGPCYCFLHVLQWRCAGTADYVVTARPALRQPSSDTTWEGGERTPLPSDGGGGLASPFSLCWQR